MGRNLKEITDKHFNINFNVKGRIDLYKEILNLKEGANKKNEVSTEHAS